MPKLTQADEHETVYESEENKPDLELAQAILRSRLEIYLPWSRGPMHILVNVKE